MTLNQKVQNLEPRILKVNKVRFSPLKSPSIPSFQIIQKVTRGIRPILSSPWMPLQAQTSSLTEPATAQFKPYKLYARLQYTLCLVQIFSILPRTLSLDDIIFSW